MKQMVVIAFLIVAAPSLGLGQTEATKAALNGEWVGVFDEGKAQGYFRVGFKTEPQRVTLTVFSILPGAAGAVADVRLESSRIRFELPRGSQPTIFEGQLQFDGQLQVDTVAGTVQRGSERGTFQLVRRSPLDPKLYDDYAGAYELQPNRIVLIRRRDELEPGPPYSVKRSLLYYLDESGRQGILNPSSTDAFFSGPNYFVPVPVELRVTFTRNAGGRVTGLRWHQTGHPEQFAPRTKLYVGEDVRFRSGTVTLDGRLLVPSTRGAHPAVIIVRGRRGMRTPVRNSVADVAEVLARHGIAALDYEPAADGQGDRPLGSLADDALAAVRYLRNRKDIDARQVGLYGESWSAVAASLAASRSRDVAFLIIVSTPGLSLGDRYLMGAERSLRASGSTEEEIQQAMAFRKLEVEFSRTGEGWEELKAAEATVRNKAWFSSTWTVTQNAESKDRPFWREQRRSSVDDHPALLVKNVACPVLGIYGELDTLVPPDPNKVLIEGALKESRSRDYTIKMIPMGDHGLWQVDPSRPGLTTGFAPGYLQTMTEWLLNRVKVSR